MKRSFGVWRRVWLACLGLWLGLGLQPGTASAQVGADVGFDLPFNHTDIMMEFSGGVAFHGNIDASLRLTYMGRLGERKVQIETDTPNLLLQYREGLNILGLEAEKRFTLTEYNETDRIGVLLGVTGGLAFGSYDGTDARPQTRFQPAVRFAPFLQTEVVAVRLGYQFLPQAPRTIFDHRIFLGVHFLIGDE
ncbi:MAG: hypothetical protein AAF570_20215 [Bacteroidota bacterium]